MALSIDEIQCQAKHIRDTLCPLVSKGGGAALNRPDFRSLMEFFTKLEKMDMTCDILRRSRIDKALLEISGAGTRWPASLVERADKMVRKWERQVGTVGELRAALWDKGGRMAGCHKRVMVDETVLLHNDGRPTENMLKLRKRWMVEATKGVKPGRYGDVNIAVGGWWIKPACAYRDGMLDDPNSDVAVGEYGAYAIVLAHGTETMTTGGTSMWSCTEADVKSEQRGGGLLNMLRNMHNRTEVRVLRSWKLKSPLAPRGGFRYDGLYAVIGYGQKRVGKTSHHTFELRRNRNQADIKKALAHPTADEYDDWIDFVQIQEERKAAEKAKVEQITFLEAINEMDGSFDEHHPRGNERIWRARDEEEDRYAAGDEEDEGLGLSTGALQERVYKQLARSAILKESEKLVASTYGPLGKPTRMNRASI